MFFFTLTAHSHVHHQCDGILKFTPFSKPIQPDLLSPHIAVPAQVINPWGWSPFLHFIKSLPISLSLSIFSFFEDLERRHYDNPVIQDISDIVQNHAAHHFEPYIVYCSNETFQQRTLQKLLWVAEQIGACCSLSGKKKQDELNSLSYHPSGPVILRLKRPWSKLKGAVIAEASPWSLFLSFPCSGSPDCPCCWMSV